MYTINASTPDPSFDLYLTTTAQAPSTKLVSDYAFYVFQIVVYIFCFGLLGLFGMMTNIINIVVFVKMGLMTDSSNISLLGLAIADFGGMSSLVNHSILVILRLMELPSLSDWDFDSVIYITAGWPHVMCAQLTCWITAYIAFERCMCVVFPFKVKTWFTPDRTRIAIISIMAYFVICNTPIFLTRHLGWVKNPETNVTQLTTVLELYHDVVRDVSYYINIYFSTTASMVVVMVCTRLITSRVQSSSNFRKKATNTTGGGEDNKKEQETNANTKKERNLIKMISIICIMFMICNLPGVTYPYIRKVVSGIEHYGKYHNLFHTMYGISFFLESISSSINILVYYNLSTRYREVFHQTFLCQREK